MKLHLMTGEELRQLADGIVKEKDRRDRATTECAFIEDRVKALGNIAAEYGVIPFEDMPIGEHLPGQVVEFEGARYRNVSGRCVTVPPGETLTVWEPLDVVPDVPDEPEQLEEEPEPLPDDGGGSLIEGGDE